MKRIKLIYTFLLAAILPLLIACSSDDLTNSSDPNKQGEKVTVTLRISPAGSTPTMRAGTATSDPNAIKPDEMMNVWTVVITDENHNVKHILTGVPTDEEKEIDPIETELILETGTYNFYSFANIGAENLKNIIGFDIPATPTTSDITHQEITTNIQFPAANKTLKDYTVKIDGNCFNPTAADNGFGSKGIPMSNMQEITVSESKKTIDLIVVRMLAKIELWLYNDYDNKDLNIESITLTDITQNPETGGNANLKLFPNYTPDKNGANEKVDYEHGDIRPNLTEDAKNGDLTIYPASDGSASLTQNSSTTWTVSSSNNRYEDTNGYPNKEKAIKITFYVNESANPQGESFFPSTSSTPSTHEAQPTPTPQKFYHYFLKIKINGEEEQRFTLIDDNGTKENEKWNYIARNDYRIIPIVLDDYKLDMIPYDFPAIGVLPASVKEEDGIYTINFHDYGHFHLMPIVTKYSSEEDNTKYIKFTPSKPNATHTDALWGLVDNDFSKSWGTWVDASKKNEYNNKTADSAFYRKDNNDTVDGDEKGGVPVWYPNGGNNITNDDSKWNPWEYPTWSPNSTIENQPFIFGYIEDPFLNSIEENPTMDKDKKVYHEFTINLYKPNSSAARQMTYRLYMILDTSQMLYPNRNNGAPRVRHPHCLH